MTVTWSTTTTNTTNLLLEMIPFIPTQTHTDIQTHTHRQTERQTDRQTQQINLLSITADKSQHVTRNTLDFDQSNYS